MTAPTGSIASVEPEDRSARQFVSGGYRAAGGRYALMLTAFLIGLAGGQRGIAPLAIVATAARRGALDTDGMPFLALFAHPAIAAGTAALSAGEMAGDKMRTAPDRTVAIGLVVRAMTSAYAGAALAAPRRRVAGALVAGVTALATAPIGLHLRKRAMARFGQATTGFVEDAVVTAIGQFAARGAAVPA